MIAVLLGGVGGSLIAAVYYAIKAEAGWRGMTAHWTETAEYVSDGDPRIVGEDDHGDWFVPSRAVDGTWDRAFRWWKPTHWPFWLRSRMTRRMAFLQSP